MKVLYFDCFSGISGDMVIGALIDAGGDPYYLTEELKKLKIDDEYELKWDKVIKNGITSTKFEVLLKDSHHEHTHQHDFHDEDHNHSEEQKKRQKNSGDLYHDPLHNDQKEADIEDQHDDREGGEHISHHSDEHGHHHHHDHHHRAYRDIVQIIEEADFSERVQTIALNIFKKIGKAEGKIHGVPLEDVHFHEVGAVDSIIDIVGTAILIDQLKIDVVKSSPIPVGSGQIHIDHGIYPVPAPATLEILRGVPIAKSTLKAELTTPTGAGIATVLADDFCTLPAMTVDSIGYGSGTKNFPDHPNVLRVIIGK